MDTACVHYADDFLVFSKTEQSAARVFKSIERYLTRKLKLVVGVSAPATGNSGTESARGYGCC